MTRRIFQAAWLGLSCMIAGCGGGGGGTTTSYGPNELAVIVDAGPTGNSVNLPFATVTVCAPGGTSCRTIDHLLVDTGSAGIRIMASVVDASAFPAQTDTAGDPVMECTQFADGYAWGPIRLADVRLASEQATSIPVQIMGDPNVPSAPSDCVNAGVNPLDSVAAFGANGVLGVAPLSQDCGPTCALSPNSSSYTKYYYACPSNAACASLSQPTDQQVQNPVGHFATDNNGIVVKMSALPGAGAPSAGGRLVFGIGTQANNDVGTPHILAVDSASATAVTTYNGNAGNPLTTYIDSGSNALFFVDSIRLCGINDIASGFYCPTARQTRTAAIEQDDGSQATVNFAVDNADNLFLSNPRYTAFGTIAGPGFLSGQFFIWGLPFFYGKEVVFVISGRPSPLGLGPVIAFQ